MTAYYNENDPFAAQWLRNLIAARHIPAGEVDDRSILDVRAADLVGFDQCHFFAGIGGWPLALALAGWRGPVWTGSCPCQPLSSAGQRKGHADERHLWPAFHRLIAECRPPAVIGEQVASKDGREWLAGIRADLEHLGYAVGAADLPAAGVGAPHIRQRLFWVADAAGRERLQEPLWQRERRCLQDDRSGGATGRLADADEPGSERWVRGRPAAGGEDQHGHAGCDGETGGSFWDAAVWLPCLDGKARRAQPGVFPLADGVSNRVGRLRAYGNAIVPQAAAAFVSAFIEARR